MLAIAAYEIFETGIEIFQGDGTVKHKISLNQLRALVISLLVACMMLVTTASWAQGRSRGVYRTGLGYVKLMVGGGRLSGVMVRKSPHCGFEKGEEVLSGVVENGTFTGTLRLCKVGEGCSGEVRAFTVGVVAGKGRRLSGSVHVPKDHCAIAGLEGEKGVIFQRMARQRPNRENEAQVEPADELGGGEEGDSRANGLIGPTHQFGTYDPRAAATEQTPLRKALREGERLLHAGRFLEARKAFERAKRIDSNDPVAYNGIGVTFYGMRDYRKAEQMYRQSIAVGPNFGDAYYNLACIFALTGRRQSALGYLKIAVLNGFVFDQDLARDADLRSIREMSEFKALMRGEF